MMCSTGLVAKPFAPRVPLALLTFAGALPDALFFLLQFLGIETFNFDQGIANHAGCFPYTNDYPFSHSLAGMVVSGMCPFMHTSYFIILQTASWM